MVDFGALFAWCDLHASRWRERAERQLEAFARGELLHAPMYYDREGFPIPARDGREPTLVWARMSEEDPEYKRVARDDLPDGSWLSTVWLGLDHQHGLGPPMIFETMRFARELSERELPHFLSGRIRTQRYHEWLEFPDPETGDMTDQLRYGTEEEALAAHHEIVRRIRIREGH